ncbi:protein LATERAL ROOT PRIMORDIUM 1 [Glycine max]|uniref:protein LATERAL ROOT PRIMORDIUM 1 n=1 Tax=Glycine max TaxID=3847 RepID=UPI0003DE8538|nr:protein LATERAL ROOT PRIMORDIUM 1 [Glycine max]|eukprot:XP_006596598.1 protein LATERAL ROOT PRIMORDIUM 1 [Glycine max]
MNRFCFEAFDRIMRDIMASQNKDNIDKPFGGTFCLSTYYTPHFFFLSTEVNYISLLILSLDLRSNQGFSVVATTRRLPSDSGAFADWAATASSGAGGGGGRAVPVDDLSLGFNAGPAAAATGPTAGMWSTQARSINYPEMGMFVVAPASSFHHHHHHQPPQHDPSVMADSLNPATALGVGVGVIPLLAATPCLESDNNILGSRTRGGGGIQLWQDQQQHHQSHYMKKQLQQGLLDHNSNTSSGNLIQNSGEVTASGTSSGGTTCQDCGNQAKKDCTNRRCRTCCKSRGFDCPTHVKSTWVPAARRRERQLMTSATAAVAGSSGSTSGTKKPRLIASQTTTTSHTSTSNTTPPRSFDTSSSHQDAGFKESLPGQVRAPAVFKCVRVTAVEDGQDEYAYQAVVKIGGHVFKGFLYDQGVENRDVYPNLSELHLGGGSGGAGRNGVSSSSPMMDPNDVYAASGGGLLGGSSAYGNPMN